MKAYWPCAGARNALAGRCEVDAAPPSREKAPGPPGSLRRRPRSRCPAGVRPERPGSGRCRGRRSPPRRRTDPALRWASIASKRAREYGPPPSCCCGHDVQAASFNRASSRGTAPRRDEAPFGPMNRHGTIVTRHATPASPSPLFPTAPMIPATWVPCPSSSRGSPRQARASMPWQSSAKPLPSSSVPSPSHSAALVQMFAQGRVVVSTPLSRMPTTTSALPVVMSRRLSRGCRRPASRRPARCSRGSTGRRRTGRPAWRAAARARRARRRQRRAARGAPRGRCPARTPARAASRRGRHRADLALARDARRGQFGERERPATRRRGSHEHAVARPVAPQPGPAGPPRRDSARPVPFPGGSTSGGQETCADGDERDDPTKPGRLESGRSEAATDRHGLLPSATLAPGPGRACRKDTAEPPGDHLDRRGCRPRGPRLSRSTQRERQPVVVVGPSGVGGGCRSSPSDQRRTEVLEQLALEAQIELGAHPAPSR